MKIFAFLWLSILPFSIDAKAFVQANLPGQLGNQLFTIAAAHALAWDNDAEACIPDLVGQQNYDIPTNRDHIFFRCDTSSPRAVSFQWGEPSHRYHPIEFHPDMQLLGYFQSEKYFAHHREKILQLFAPRPDDWSYIQNKYQWLMDHPLTVAIHVREVWEDPSARIFIQYGRNFLSKAMAMFPPEALFIVISNNHHFARNNIPQGYAHRVIHIEGEPHYIDFYLLTLCKHNIFTPSTFGWWGAWMNTNPNKIVITTSQWFNPYYPKDTSDIVPANWIRIDAKYGPLNKPKSYQ